MTPNFDDSWRSQGPKVALAAKSAQLGAARAATPYLKDVLAELDIPDKPTAAVAPDGFVGVAGDGRPVDSLLYGAVVTAKQATADGASPQQALEQGERWLDMTLETLLADTGRAAVSAGMTARPAVTGWVRMLDLPSCSRCVVLAGKFFRWNEGFLRHPSCDCRHIPATEHIAGSLTTDPQAAYQSGQVRGLTAAQRKALDDGANFGRVVNSRRGMDSAWSETTREATTRRRQRLSPEGIYLRAGDNRDEALRLLKANGYLTT